MAFSLDPPRVMEEIRSQRSARDDRLAGVLDLISKYPGSWWDMPPGLGGDFEPNRAGFEYLTFMLAQLVWANPRWRTSTRRPRAQQLVAEAIGHGLNRWTVDGNLKTTLEDIAVDFIFGWGVGHVTLRPRRENYEAEDPELWPQFSRISPLDHGWDHRAPSYRRARMKWHEYRIDKDDLLETAKIDKQRPRDRREGWLIDSIRELQETEGTQRNDLWSRNRGSDYGISPNRKQVRCIEVYYPSMRLPNKPGPSEGFNGTIMTLGVVGNDGEQAIILKPPAPCFGPRWGHYILFGCYSVPDSTFPLSPLIGAAGNIEQAGRLSQAVDSQVAAYKRLILVSAQDPILATQIKNGRTDNVFHCRTIQDLDRMVRQLEMGGTTPGNVAAEARALNNQNRVLGMDDVQRGNVTGEGTATEVREAVDAAASRVGTVKSRFQDPVRAVGKTLAWFFYHTDEISFPLGAEATERLGNQLPQLGVQQEDELIYQGGDFDDNTGATFDDLELEIEPYSMERPSESFLKARGELISTVIQLAPAIVQTKQAGGDPKGILDALGDSQGFPNLSRLFPNIESVDPSQMQPEAIRPRLKKQGGLLGQTRPSIIGSDAGGVGAVGRQAQQIPEVASPVLAKPQ